jgi:hypothetical protein
VDVLADEQTIDGLVTAVLDDAHEQNGKVKGA